ncbi:MAG: peptidoglycan-binding protein [Micropruina sp.]
MTTPRRALAAVACLILLFSLVITGNSADAVTSAQQSYINKLVPTAQSVQRSTGVPASVLLAQAIDASNWGKAKPATQAKNYFGTECSSAMTSGQFANLARAQVGKPYVLGAEASVSNPNPPKFDCSELVEWLYGRSGNRITDLAASQYNVTKAVAKGASPRVGDLVFLRNNPARSNGIGHVAVLTAKLANGDWEVVEAKGRAYGVVKTTYSYWKTRKYYAGLRRYAKLKFVGTDGVRASAAATYQAGCVTISKVSYSKYNSMADSFKARAAALLGDSAYAKARAVMGQRSALVDAIAKADRPKTATAYAKSLKKLIADYRLADYDVAPFSLVLLPGATGAKVTAAQHLLRATGSSVKVTGVYDKATVAAVKAYQKSKKLQVDGEAGPITLTSLAAQVKSGSTGERVRAVHALLQGVGYVTSSGASFGSATVSAVKAFQTAAGRNPTGVVDANTWAALFMTLGPAPAPMISGSLEVGGKLTVKAGSWGPGAVSLSYRWYRDGKSITGATKTSYTVQTADAGRVLTVAVTGSKAKHVTVVRKSAATSRVPLLALTKTPVPTVTGTAKVGEKLTAKAGAWAPTGVVLTYQWFRGTTAVAGATKATYVVQAADAGAALSVRTTGALTGYARVTKASRATAAVAKGTLTKATASITGTAKAGKKLTAVPGAWQPAPVAYTYQWYRGSTAIKGATKAAYTVTTKDRGAKLSVTVRGTKAGYVTVEKKASVTVAK